MLLTKKVNLVICIYTYLVFGMYFLKGYSQDKNPNFIIILTDDQGYNDLGYFR